ncbi:organic cation transporter protein-like [Acanthaster planci]|uniref:Organic cation transporter protein-like n=1 Tax=Acanthaster planci TaxID=133434 RepID=A0A8B7XJ80_ACAPL|nr:organic cation transporter protein-like [Acanthaster planci]
MDVDISLKAVGDFGRVQGINFVLFGLCLTLASIQSNSIAFTIDQSVEHYCKPPQGFSTNQTAPLSNDTGRDIFHSCRMYDVLNGTLTDNLTTCQDGFEYPSEQGATSVVTDLNLVCDRSLLGGTLMSMHFVGFLVGCFLTGQAADMFGRRTVCMGASLLISLLGTSISFIWNLKLMMAARFFLGLVLPGNTLVCYVRMVEMALPRHRLLANQIIQLFSYESIRWLVQKGRVEKAVSILQRVAKSKKIQYEGESLMSRLSDIGVPTTEKTDGLADTPSVEDDGPTNGGLYPIKRHYSFFHLFRTRILIKYTLIMFLCWFVMNALYFGFIVYSTSLAGNKYLNFFLLALIEAPVSAIDFVLMKRFGRRRPLIFSFFACAVACYFTGFLPGKTANGTELTALIVAMAMVGKYFSTAAYEVTMLIGAEVFPTVLRNIATGSSATVGKTSTIIAPFIVLLKDAVSFLPMTIFGTLSLVAAFCVCLLPETRNRPLPEQFEDPTKLERQQEDTI